MRGGYLDAIARKTGRRKFSYLCPRQNTIPMRYFLELRYNGAAYCGWQRQPDQPSVQQTLERALSTLLREQLEDVLSSDSSLTERMIIMVSWNDLFTFVIMLMAILTYIDANRKHKK